MNTYQMSIKTDILLWCCRSPRLGSIAPTRDHHIGSQRTDQGGEFKRTNTDLPNMYRRSATETIMSPIGQNILLIYPHFGIDFLQGLFSDNVVGII